ncbi:hypothetical protein BK025_09075 [Sodalis sp. TME1]|nr:hypothetical protein BK025_09075 [Sodalis sp. TME1]
MKNIIPNSGKQVMLRDKRTGAPWLASFNYINQHYSFQPVGNLRVIRREFESLEVPAEFEPAGTHYTEFL